VRAWQSLQAIALQGVPQNLYLKMRLMPEPSSAVFGMRLRAADDFASGYDLAFHAAERLVRLHGETIYAVDGLDRPFDLEVVLYDDMIDVCIDRRRCIVNRCPELKGDQFFCFAHNADVTFRDIEIRPLKSPIVYESENKNCANPA
jgi:hypothetical protein